MLTNIDEKVKPSRRIAASILITVILTAVTLMIITTRLLQHTKPQHKQPGTHSTPHITPEKPHSPTQYIATQSLKTTH